MPKFLVTWKVVNSRLPEDAEARHKRDTAFTEMVQQALKAGALKDWGCAPDGQKGYAIFEGKENDMALMAQLYLPYFEFQDQMVLTADELLEVLKKV